MRVRSHRHPHRLRNREEAMTVDYDALREERDRLLDFRGTLEAALKDSIKHADRLLADRDEFMQLALDAANERNKQLARAEAAEAKVAQSVKRIDHEISVWAGRMSTLELTKKWPQAQEIHAYLLQLRAALNEGAGE